MQSATMFWKRCSGSSKRGDSGPGGAAPRARPR